MDSMNWKENSLSSPYLPEIGILNLVNDVWGGPWRRRHQILTRLSKYMNIVWCNPPSSWRMLGKPKPIRNSEVQYHPIEYGTHATPSFAIYQPEPWLPVIGKPRFLGQWTTQQRLKNARRLLLARGCQKTILFLWRPQFESALDQIPYDLSVYDINDEYSFSTVEKPVDERAVIPQRPDRHLRRRTSNLDTSECRYECPDLEQRVT